MNNKECFCLLGTNGAGKTTFISIILQQLVQTSGNIYIQGYNTLNLPNNIKRNFGYCSQHNSLFNELTTRQTVIFFCELRGITNDVINDYVNYYIYVADLQQHEHTLAKNLSGKNYHINTLYNFM